MPQLPDIDSLGARPVPVSRRRVSSVRNAGAVGGAVAEVGGTVSKIGERLDEIHDEDDFRRRDLEHVEAVRVIRQEAKQAQGANAQPAAQQAEQKIKDLNARLIAGARSKRAREALETSILRRSGTEIDSISEHALTETTRVMEGTILARRDALIEDAEEAWDRPEVFEQNLTSAQGEIAAWGKWKGLSPEAIALEQRAARAKARTSVAQRMVSEGDYDKALTYIDLHSEDIGAEAENALRAVIRDPMEEEAGEAIVARIVTGEAAAPPTAAAPSPTEVVPRMQGITAQAESGNRERDARGRLITSPKGAQGLMQVMPGTNVAPGFGVRPAQNDSDAERSRVGRDYLAAMMTRYGNDPAKAWAAYNWGPGKLDAAIRRHGDGWLASAPKETRAYVNGNMAMLGRGSVSNAALTPAGRRIDYAEARAEIDALDLPYDLKRKTLAALNRRMAAEDQVTARNEEDATKQALGVVEGLGDGFTNMNQIPVSVRMAMPVATRISLQERAERNAKGDKGTLTPEMAAYIQFTELANPSKYITPEFRTELASKGVPLSVITTVAARAGQISGAIAAAKPDPVSDGALWALAKPAFEASGLFFESLQTKPASSARRTEPLEDAQRKERAVGYLRDIATRWANANPGKHPDEATMRSWVGTALRGIGPTGRLQFEASDEQLVASFSPTLRARAEKALRDSGQPVNNQTLAAFYREAVAAR